MLELIPVVVVVVLVLGFVRVPAVVMVVYYAWLVMMAAVVIDISLLCFRLNAKLKEQWPDKAERKGALFYGSMRSLTLRRLRLPPPKVKAGGAPVPPKAPKAARGSKG